jgi:medium-chain acyl-[acyl-carrier-protein] hydrolase
VDAAAVEVVPAKIVTIENRPAETNYSYSSVSDAIKGRIRKVLGFDSNKTIDENKNFLDLGLDSLTMVNLTAEIKDLYPGKLQMSHNLLFEKSTVKKLSEFICQEFGSSSAIGPKTLQRAASLNVESWVKIWDPKPNAQFRIFCFHYAGGSALMYKEWCQYLPPEIELCAIQLPGRWDRMSEPMTSLEKIMGPMTDAIATLLDKPYAVFGYSMGGAFAFELVRELRRRGRQLPVHLFAAACSPPHMHKGSAAASFGPMSDEAFLARFKNIFGSIYGEKEMLESSMKDTWIGTLRNDMNALSSYTYHPEQALQIPITALGGAKDNTLPLETLEQWKMQTSAQFEAKVFNGGHLFIHEIPTDELIETLVMKVSMFLQRKAS